MRIVAHICIALFAVSLAATPTLAQETEFDQTDPAIARSLDAYREANEAWEAEDVEKAEGLAREALTIRTRALGPTHRLTGHALVLLASLLSAQGKHEEAAATSTDAVAVRRLDPELVYLADALRVRSDILLKAGHVDEAETAVRESIGIAERDGEEGEFLAWLRIDLASLLLDKQRYAEARELLERSLEQLDTGSAERDLELRYALFRYAVATSDGGDDTAAIPIYHRVAEIEENSFGPMSPDVADTLFYLGKIYSQLGRHDDAISIFRRILQIREANDPTMIETETVEALSWLGHAMLIAERPSDAVPFLKRALNARRTLLPPGAQKLYGDALLYSTALWQSDQIEAATNIMRETLQFAESTGQWMNAANSANRLARLLVDQLDWQQAETFARYALILNDRAESSSPVTRAAALITLGNIFTETGNPDAITFFEEALTIFESTKEGGDFNLDAMSNLGKYLSEHGTPLVAEPLLRRGVALYEKFDEDALDTNIARLWLANLLASIGSFDEAATLYSRSGGYISHLLGTSHPTAIDARAQRARFELFDRMDLPRARALYAKLVRDMAERTARSSTDPQAERFLRAFAPTFKLSVRANWELAHADE